MKHFIFYYKRKPLVAVPLDGGFKVAFSGLCCLPSNTYKRKFFKIYMFFRILFHYLSKSRQSNELDNFLKQWLNSHDIFEKHFGVFIWSRVLSRDRYYVHLLDKLGNKHYFAKITKKIEDFKNLENEKINLITFANAKTFSVPEVIHFERQDSFTCLITSSFNKNYKLYLSSTNDLPYYIYKEISGYKTECKIKELIDCKSFSITDALNKYLNKINSETLIKVSRSHGDMGSENIFINEDGKFLIIDWESGAEKSPFLLDKIAFWLGKHNSLIKKNSKAAFIKFNYEFKSFNDLDIAMALYFLNKSKFDLSIALSNHWDK